MSKLTNQSSVMKISGDYRWYKETLREIKKLLKILGMILGDSVGTGLAKNLIDKQDFGTIFWNQGVWHEKEDFQE